MYSENRPSTYHTKPFRAYRTLCNGPKPQSFAVRVVNAESHVHSLRQLTGTYLQTEKQETIVSDKEFEKARLVLKADKKHTLK